MNRKENLIKSLKVATNALKNDTIHYNWKEQESCNMGVVSQAVLNKTSVEISKDSNPMFKKLDKIDKERIQHTWKNAVKYTCSITGKKIPKIIKELEQAGISREDIVHLEYLENPAILVLSGIDKEAVYGDVVVGKENKMVKVAHPNFFLSFLGIKVSVLKEIDVIENKIIDYEYPEDYYKKKENLIKYLVAWVSILENDNSFENVKDDLEAKLINAVVDEDYESAAILRDKILFTK